MWDVPLRKSLALRWAAIRPRGAAGKAAARPMAGIRCWRRRRFLSLGAVAAADQGNGRPRISARSVLSKSACCWGLASHCGAENQIGPPMRIVLLLGLIFTWRWPRIAAAEILGLLAPLVLAVPARPANRRTRSFKFSRRSARCAAGWLAGVAMALGWRETFAYASVHPFAPHMRGSPVAAVARAERN